MERLKFDVLELNDYIKNEMRWKICGFPMALVNHYPNSEQNLSSSKYITSRVSMVSGTKTCDLSIATLSATLLAVVLVKERPESASVSLLKDVPSATLPAAVLA